VYATNPTGEFTAVHQMNDLVVGRVDESLAFFHDRFLTVLRQSHDALSTTTTRVLPMLQRSAAPSKNCLASVRKHSPYGLLASARPAISRRTSRAKNNG